MKVKCHKDDIIDGLQKAAGVIPAKGAAYLRTIWIKTGEETLTIHATDTALEFTGSYPAEVLAPGLAGVQGKAFVDLVRKLPSGQLTLSLDAQGSGLRIEQGARQYKLPTNDPSWFQQYAAFPDAGSVFWSGQQFQDLIERVAFCIAEEETMEAISCLAIKRAPGQDSASIEMCGLNGHKFAMVSFENDEILAMLPPEGLLLHRKYVQELKKWLPTDAFEMALADDRLFCRGGDGADTLSLPVSKYQYPDYHNFLARLAGDNNSTLSLPRQELYESLDRLLIFNSDSSRCTFFSFEPAHLVLTAQGQDVGVATETLDCQFQGDLKRIAFPTKDMMEILSHFSSDQMRLVLTGMEGPCGLGGGDDVDYQVIIMPMKIVEEAFYSEEKI